MHPQDISHKSTQTLEGDLANLVAQSNTIGKAEAELQRAKQMQQAQWKQMLKRAPTGHFPERAIVNFYGTLYEVIFDIDEMGVPEVRKVDNWTGYYEVK